MKKINPKVTKLAITLMALLIAGGTALAFKEVAGEDTAACAGAGPAGMD